MAPLLISEIETNVNKPVVPISEYTKIKEKS